MSSRTNSLIQNKQVTLQKQMQRALTKMKAPQPIGGDILTTIGIPDNNLVYLGNVTLSSGQTVEFIYNISPVNQTLTLWNFGWTLYIDPTNFQSNGVPNSSNQWANGLSLTSAQRNVNVTSYLDWADSSDSTNKRVFKLTVRNNDTGSHTYYAAARFYLPYLPGQ